MRKYTLIALGFMPEGAKMTSVAFDGAVLYGSVAEFEARSAFVGPLTMSIADLDRIVGKYLLPEDPSNWATCSLNGCTKPHRRGFILRSKTGQETNCGKDCAKREFGTDFDEFEASYQKIEEAAARRAAVDALLVERDALLSEATRLLPLARRASNDLSDFRSHLCSHGRGFWIQLEKCAKLGGAIRVAIRSREGWNTGPGRREQLQTIGSIAGAAVVLSNSQGIHHSIGGTIIPWLEGELVENKLGALDDKGLKEILKASQAYKELLRRAERFVSDATKFLNRENAANFELVREHLMSRGMERDDLRAAIPKWVASRPD